MSLSELLELNQRVFQTGGDPVITAHFGKSKIPFTSREHVKNIFIYTGQRSVLRIGSDYAFYFDDYCNLGDALEGLGILPSFYSTIDYQVTAQVSNLIYKDGALVKDDVSFDGNTKDGYSVISRRTSTTLIEGRQMSAAQRYYLIQYNQLNMMYI